jgi:MFS family permease
MKVGQVKRGIVFSFDRIRKAFTFHKGITQLILINMLAMFFNEFGNPFYMIFLKENLKAPEYVLGLAMSALSVGAFIAGFPSGVFSDIKRRRQPFIVFGYIVALIAVGITAFSWHPWMIVVTFLLFGISNTITMNSVSAYFTGTAGQEKMMAYGAYTSLGWLCAIVSPIIAGFVAENYGLRTPFIINFAGLFFSTVLLTLFFREKQVN